MRILPLFLFLLLPLGLAACGMTPVYSSSHYTQGVAADMAQIEIASIPEKSGLDLRNELMDRMYRHGRPAAPHYKLSIDAIYEKKAGLGISKDASVTRSQLRLGTTMRLIDTSTEKTLLKRQVQAVTSYNVLDSHFTTLVSEREARQNGIKELAEQILIQLDLFLSSPDRQKEARKKDEDK